ncbi:histidine kinase [Pseudomonas sp. Rh2]|uniref:Histidine kinase n=2 Tax=Pseudomonas TaxID=286 RepID=A0ABR6V8G3_9PSED|nr:MULTISPECIES: histidine kinase [Pseudomonas]MBC3476777.1 histidine kinase [Pseudomonas taiwanensis]MBC3492623.1 histidine kinase [Pseudomonas taiwanensis]QQZ37834.1 histidine kinase [Pseudomonas sp. SK2]
MMDHASSNSIALQEFLLDAQILLTQSQECLQHLELIDNDPDACNCLNNTLDTLARRANDLGLIEVALYAEALQRMLAPACHERHLKGEALPAVDACLTLLAWQLELVDPRTGRLSLDTCEQTTLLGELARILGQPAPQTCASCNEREQSGAHPHSAAPAQRSSPL